MRILCHDKMKLTSSVRTQSCHHSCEGDLPRNPEPLQVFRHLARTRGRLAITKRVGLRIVLVATIVGLLLGTGSEGATALQSAFRELEQEETTWNLKEFSKHSAIGLVAGGAGGYMIGMFAWFVPAAGPGFLIATFTGAAAGATVGAVQYSGGWIWDQVFVQ